MLRKDKDCFKARVQQELIENESLLDISIELTRINCEIEAMREIDTRRGAADVALLERMMSEHAFEYGRLQRWRELLEAATAESA